MISRGRQDTLEGHLNPKPQTPHPKHDRPGLGWPSLGRFRLGWHTRRPPEASDTPAKSISVASLPCKGPAFGPAHTICLGKFPLEGTREDKMLVRGTYVPRFLHHQDPIEYTKNKSVAATVHAYLNGKPYPYHL